MQDFDRVKQDNAEATVENKIAQTLAPLFNVPWYDIAVSCMHYPSVQVPVSQDHLNKAYCEGRDLIAPTLAALNQLAATDPWIEAEWVLAQRAKPIYGRDNTTITGWTLMFVPVCEAWRYNGGVDPQRARQVAA